MSDEGFSAPQPLTGEHDTASFDCGSNDLNAWLRDWALINHRSGNCRVFVVAEDSRVVGFYALATASVERGIAPSSIKRGGVPTEIPCFLLARLAVDTSAQGRGLGSALLADAILRSIRVSEHVGVRALIIHAADTSARDFYLDKVAFVASPVDPLLLFLHMKRAREIVVHGR